MKDFLLRLLQAGFLLSVIFTFAQNYNFFPKGQKAYYLDTTRTEGFGNENYLFYLPQPEFKSENSVKDSVFLLFGENVNWNSIPFDGYVKMHNGDQKIYLTFSEDTLFIPKNAQPGDSWTGLISYDGNNQTVSYVQKIFEPVCGINDSVKVYSLQGKTIKVSKNFGLVEVPVGVRVFYNSQHKESHLRLFALEKLKPHFNFLDLRNVVWFREGYIYGGTNAYYNSSYIKDYVRFEIISKEIEEDSVSYQIGFWDDELYHPGNAEPEVSVMHRDTAALVVKSNRVYSSNSRLESYLQPHVSFAENRMGYIKFVESDTIVSIGEYVAFEGSSNIVSTSLQQGYKHKLEEFGSPQPLLTMRLELYCYYPLGAPEEGCEEIEAIMPVIETLSGESTMVCFYDAASKEIKISWKNGLNSTAKISILDVQGRSVFTTTSSSGVSIPSDFSAGYYQVLIEMENEIFRKSLSVY